MRKEILKVKYWRSYSQNTNLRFDSFFAIYSYVKRVKDLIHISKNVDFNNDLAFLIFLCICVYPKNNAPR